MSGPLTSTLARGKKRPHKKSKKHKHHHKAKKHKHKKKHHTKKSQPAPVTPVVPVPPETVADPDVVHLADRFTGGYTAAQGAEIAAAGGPLAWFDKQLAPDQVAESTRGAELSSWFPLLAHTPAQRYASERSGGFGSWEYGIDLASWTILRRVHTTRAVHEAMVELWSDHLHIPVGSDGWYWRQDYDALIRTHALGKFSTLLVAASLHPAMLVFLNNAESTAEHPDENQGRELLELHTVGRGLYDEDQVKASARILSGWTVKWPWDDDHPAIATWSAYFDPERHATGAATVLGFSSSGDGRGGQSAQDYLDYLAHHPATARRIATKVATRFVSDTPSDGLVATLAQVYLDNDTDIRPVLKALVRHPEFAAAAKQKVRTPVADLVASIRLLGIDVHAPTSRDDAAFEMVFVHGGLQPYSWPRPDGPPDTAADYASASRMLNSFAMHWNLAGGYWPSDGVTYRSPGAFVPAGTPTVAEYAEHLCRLVHATGTTSVTTQALAQAIGMSPTDRLDPTSWQYESLQDWLGVRALGVVLDHPRHLTR
jgi:hypothetical protein